MIDRKAFRTLSYGLFVISSKMSDGRDVGCVANTFQQIASDPARVCVSLNKQNTTTAAVQESGRFTASVLSEAADMELIGAFGFRCSLDINKFEQVSHEIDTAQIPFLTQMSVAMFSVCVEQTIDVGSHLLFIGSVDEACMTPPADNASEKARTPMTYRYYHEVLRGKTPPKAASYQDSSKDAEDAQAESANAPRYAWQCTLCGHIEYVDELPDDFVCPICGVDKSFFERIEI